jgi:hypothetical protein
MSLEYINRMYDLQIEVGGRVRYTGNPKAPREGEVTGAKGSHVLIRLDGEKTEKPYHPTWELEYLS